MAMPGVKATAGQALTGREWEVLDGFLEGLSDKQIAASLHLSHHTVHNHAKALYTKLGVNSRGELLSLFVVDAEGAVEQIVTRELDRLNHSKV